VWNRTVEKSKSLEPEGAVVAASPKAVAESSDIIFGLMPNEATAVSTAKEVAQGMQSGKAFEKRYIAMKLVKFDRS
jgi:3-hydroxyisobutyrate dehydrogenase-like beta-hydroxyacid dehydrogenase